MTDQGCSPNSRGFAQPPTTGQQQLDRRHESLPPTTNPLLRTGSSGLVKQELAPGGADPERALPCRSMLDLVIGAGEAVQAVATAQHGIPGYDTIGDGAFRIRLQPALCPTDDQFYEFCRLNRELRIERSAEGEVTIMPPAGWESARRNAEITAQLQAWATRDGAGTAVDSSAGYVLPNGAVRSPDASWVSSARLASVTAEQRSRFLPLCPDFVIELRTPADRLPVLQDKMAEYIANGTSLGWLIDPLNREVFVYRPGLDVERLDQPESLLGHPMMTGFELRMDDVW